MDAKRMKKQLVIVGIVLLFVCVGLSGCDDYVKHPPVLSSGDPNFVIMPIWEDNFATVSQGGYTGTVWVNVTVRNMGDDGSQTIWVEVYQGTGNYTNCGKGYESHSQRSIYLAKSDGTVLTFIFTGVENHNNSGCYGVKYRVE
jgi:hypothetical protein